MQDFRQRAMQRPAEFASTFANAEGRQRYEEIWSEMIDGIIGRLQELRTDGKALCLRRMPERCCKQFLKCLVVLNYSFNMF